SRDSLSVMRDCKEEDGQIMCEAAQEDKDVPKGMIIAAIVTVIKVDAEGVEDATSQNPQNAGERNGVNHGHNGQNANPSHQQIDGKRDPWVTVAGYTFVNQSCHRATPNGNHHGPSQPAVEAEQGEGRVGAGNQQ